MPGIVGVCTSRPPSEGTRVLSAMVDRMCHQPFFQCGATAFPELGLYIGWTAHDKSDAHRRCTAPEWDGLTLFTSGELLDVDEHSDIRTRYRASQGVFPSPLNHVLSGILIDRPARRAYLFADPHGLERLYIHQTNDTLYFASEAKAILAVAPSTRAFDETAIAELFAFGCTLGDATLFSGIRILESGAVWAITSEGWAHYGSTSLAIERDTPLDAAAFSSALTKTLPEVLPRYVHPSSAVALSLTGGLDTRMILAALHRPSAVSLSYTFAGLRGDTRDVAVARKVAMACDIPHAVIRLEEDFLQQFGNYLDHTVYVTDGTSGLSGAHEIYLNAKARTFAPIRLTGNFGSEVLRGVTTLKRLTLAPGILRPDFRRLVRDVLPSGPRDPVMNAILLEIPRRLYGTLAAARSQVTFRTPFLDDAIISLALRASSAARSGDDVVLSVLTQSHPALARIPTDRGIRSGSRTGFRSVARLAAQFQFKLDYFDSEAMPGLLALADPILHYGPLRPLLGTHKYLPYRRWLRHELHSLVTETLTDSQILRLSFLDPDYVARMPRHHRLGLRNYFREIDTVMTLQAVDRLLLTAPRPSVHSRIPVTGELQ